MPINALEPAGFRQGRGGCRYVSPRVSVRADEIPRSRGRRRAKTRVTARDDRLLHERRGPLRATTRIERTSDRRLRMPVDCTSEPPRPSLQWFSALQHRGRIPGHAYTRTIHTDSTGVASLSTGISTEPDTHGREAARQAPTPIRADRMQRGKCCVSSWSIRSHGSQVRVRPFVAQSFCSHPAIRSLSE